MNEFLLDFIHRVDGNTCVSLVDWISDTLSQGYTNLQSLVNCLDHRNIVSDTVCSQAKVVLGCVIHVYMLLPNRGSSCSIAFQIE